jgi:Xaa-Pro aminopeptidase
VTPSVTYLLLDGRYFLGDRPDHAWSKKHNSIMIQRISHDRPVRQVLAELFHQHEITRVILDSSITTVAQENIIKQLGVEVAYEENHFQKLRELKKAYEIENINKARRIALEAFAKLTPDVVPGVTENTLAARLEFLMRIGGAHDRAFETIVAGGPNSALPHARTTDRALTEADAVVIDFGCVYEGYCCDITHTILMPRAPESLRRMYDVVKTAQQAAIHKATVGTPLADIDAAARDIIQQAGYGSHFPHATGHGVGMEVHELPLVGPSSTGCLQKGHVITIEPGIYAPGLGGVRLEEMLVI